MEILLATKNKNKFIELKNIFDQSNSEHELLFYQDLIEVEEDKETIFDNAKFASILSAYDRLADEFGIVGTGGDPINTATVPQIVPSSMSEYRPFDESQVAPLSSTLPTLDSMGKGVDLPKVNSQVPIANNSTLSQTNVINPNTMAAGQSVFGLDDPVFSGIMSTNVGRQRVA